MLYVVHATPRHVRQLSPNLRTADRQEIKALTGLEPGPALTASYCVSTFAYTVLRNGWPVGVGGIVEQDHGTAEGWLVGSDDMTSNWVEFAKGSLSFVRNVFDRYELVTNLVDVRNTVHLRWLEWFGCKFSPPIMVGKECRPFVRFYYSCLFHSPLLR